MKIAYRIVTPFLALGAIAMGIFLDMFNFVVGSTDDSVNSLITSIASLLQQNGSNISTTYGFSVFKLIGMMSSDTETDTSSFMDIIEPILPQLIAFLVIMVLIVLVFIAIAVCGSAIGNVKKRNRTIYCLSAAGLVLMFANIIVTNNAFSHIIAGDIDITTLVSMFTDSALAQLATAILSVTEATLSAGFYAMFGMFMLIIIWTIIAGFVISSPVVPAKKTYKRKKPMRDPFAAKKAKKAEAEKKAAKEAAKAAKAEAASTTEAEAAKEEPAEAEAEAEPTAAEPATATE